MPRLGPLLEQAVGGLGIHVDEPAPLLHRHQVKGGLSGGVGGLLHVDGAAGHQQLFAPAGVLHMDGQLLPIQQHLGNEPVRPAQKDSLMDILIAHPRLLSSWGTFISLIAPAYE